MYICKIFICHVVLYIARSVLLDLLSPRCIGKGVRTRRLELDLFPDTTPAQTPHPFFFFAAPSIRADEFLPNDIPSPVLTNVFTGASKLV